MTGTVSNQSEGISGCPPITSGPKRQHYLPRFYLDGFTRDELLAVYDRDEKTLRRQTPNNTAVIGHFYTLIDGEGRKRFELESHLAEVEAKASEALRVLISGGQLDEQQRAKFSYFVALCVFRTPDLVESVKHLKGELVKTLARFSFSDIARTKDILRGSAEAAQSEEQLDEAARGIVEFAQSGKYEVEVEHEWAVATALGKAADIGGIFVQREWFVFHVEQERDSFVTTDAPVTLMTTRRKHLGFYGVGFGSEDAVVQFPVSQKTMLVMRGLGTTIQHAGLKRELIRRANIMTVERCKRYVFGRDIALVSSLVDASRLAGKRWRPKMQITT